jgi:hypothetical protein
MSTQLQIAAGSAAAAVTSWVAIKAAYEANAQGLSWQGYGGAAIELAKSQAISSLASVQPTSAEVYTNPDGSVGISYTVKGNPVTWLDANGRLIPTAAEALTNYTNLIGGTLS